MAGGRSYDIFPRTWKARMLIGLAFLGGLGVMVAYFVSIFTVQSFGFGVAPWDFFDRMDITLVNRTPYYVTVYADDRKEAVLEPNETETIREFKVVWWTDRPVEARDPGGRILYSANLDDDDLERMDFRIIIEEPP